jgi:hypothetical protein
MTKKQKNKTIEDKDETIIEMAPIIKEKYTKLFLIISLTLSSLSVVLMTFFFVWFSSNDFEKKIYQETVKSSDNLNKIIYNFKKEIKQEIENLRNDFVTNNQKFSNFNSKIFTDKLNEIEKKINDLNSKVIDFEKNKVSNVSDPNVLSEDNNIRNDNDTKTTENKETKLDELIQEFEDLKSKLLSKEQFDYTKERNVFNDIINKLSGFFKLRDYGDNDSPRSLITKAEKKALNGDLKSVLYYLEKLPDDWKVGLENFISKCKLFLAKENG